MIGTDVGFVLYWVITALHVLPAESLFKDYGDDLVVAWNWSFLPLDLLVSGTGLTALALARRGVAAWRPLTIVSLTLTSVSGLQAISFWTIRGDLSLSWWLPNLFLLLYPLVPIAALVGGGAASREIDGDGGPTGPFGRAVVR
ncbi:YvaD family protein [Spirillospora sp. NBC_00431]